MSAAAPAARRFALLDSLRGVAVLCVLALHTAQLSGANAHAVYGNFTSHLRIGVTLFFLLSGFLLYRPHALAIAQGSPAPRPGEYTLRRFLRIAPAYWVALSVLVLWPGVNDELARNWWVYYGFAQSYRSEWALEGIRPAWSLSVEVAFYALLPLLGALLRRASAGLTDPVRVRLQLAVFALLGTASLALRAASFASVPLGDLETTLFTHFLWFAVGMSLAVWSVWQAEQALPGRVVRVVVERPGLSWLLALLLYVALCNSPGIPRAFTPGYTRWTYTAEHVVYAAIALLLLLPAVFGEQAGGLPRRMLASPLLRWIGLISYSLFLWHYQLLEGIESLGGRHWIPGWPLLALSLAALPVIFAVAAASYACIERPLLRWKARHAPASGAAAAGVARETTAQSSTRR